MLYINKKTRVYSMQLYEYYLDHYSLIYHDVETVNLLKIMKIEHFWFTFMIPANICIYAN